MPVGHTFWNGGAVAAVLLAWQQKATSRPFRRVRLHAASGQLSRQLAGLKSAEEILDFCARSLSEFNSIQIASAFYKLARCEDASIAGRQAFQALVTAAEVCNTWTPRSIASTLWSIARMRCDLPLFASLIQAAVPLMPGSSE